jgi:VWFA-related protein
MQKVAILVSGLVLVALLSTSIHSQTGAQQEKSETIKLRSTEVFVDAVVVDRKNRLITDLSPADFEIYEDGVLQEITSFRVIRGAAEKPPQPAVDRKPLQAATAQSSTSGAASVTTREMPPHLTIVLLDYSTTQFENKKLIQDASIKYIEQKLQPNDYMAVFVLGAGLKLVTDFTKDKPRLIAALKSVDLTGSALAYDRANLNATIDVGQSPQMQFQEGGGGAGAAPSGQSAAAAAAELASRLSALGTAIIAQHTASLDFALRSGIDRRQSLGVLSAIRAIAMGVKGIEGRKTLMLFSEGFVVGTAVEDELRSVASLANRSQLAIYCIESQGLETREIKSDLVPRDELTSTIENAQENKRPRGGETGFDRARQVGRDMKEAALRYVANSTGGFLIRNTNNLGIGLERVDQEMRSYYLVSYRPKDDKLDGRFRQIRVNVKRSDLSVRARSGYYAIPAGYESLTPGEFQLLDQARKTDPAAKIPLFVRVGIFHQANALYRVPVILEMPANSIQFDDREGRRLARLAIVGLVRDRTGELVKRFGGPVQVDVTTAEYNVLKAGTVSFLNHVQLPPGPDYTFEVLVKDIASGKVSSNQQTLSLHQSEPRLSLSTILLSGEVDKAAANSTDNFLTVQGVKILPSARCQFHNGDNLIFYFEIYNPQTQRENKKSDVAIELSLMRDGQLVNAKLPRYRVTEDPGDAAPHITFARYLHLTGLSAGNYSLIVDVKDALGSQTARGQAPFSLVN